MRCTGRGLGAIWRARRISNPHDDRYVIKIFRSPLGIGPAERDRQLTSFLERTDIQKQVSEGNGVHHPIGGVH